MANILDIRFEINEAQPGDVQGIRSVILAAFQGAYEADLVEALRRSCPVFISLVARVGMQAVGHILFTPVNILQKGEWIIEGMGVGPLAVLPQYQGLGIGSALCREGMEKIAKLNYPFVVVLGHPSYYPRFGFHPAHLSGIVCGFEGVPDEAFMIHVFDAEAMSGVTGVAYSRPEFDSDH